MIEDQDAEVHEDRIVLGDGEVIHLDRENAAVFARPGEHTIVWPQPDGTCWVETRPALNRAARRRGERPAASTFTRPS